MRETRAAVVNRGRSRAGDGAPRGLPAGARRAKMLPSTRAEDPRRPSRAPGMRLDERRPPRSGRRAQEPNNRDQVPEAQRWES